VQVEVEFDSIGDGVVVVRVRGEIDMSTTPELMERVLPAVESGPRGIVVDLSPGGIPRRVLEVTGMDETFRTAWTVAAAVELLG
jgi:hypothetical protein